MRLYAVFYQSDSHIDVYILLNFLGGFIGCTNLHRGIDWLQFIIDN